MLPELIEIVALQEPVRARITVPGSKSITNRALVLAALADGDITLRGALWSDDTRVMVNCLLRLGFQVKVEADRHERCNRNITVRGRNGEIPRGGTKESPLELFVGNAGTAARFVSALVCLGRGVYRLSGVDRMHERPQKALFAALRQLGYTVLSQNDKLPAIIYGAGPQPGTCQVSIKESSQFASALMLCARHGQWQVDVTDEDSEESSYVKMTQQLIEAFPKASRSFHIEPDSSSASYFWAANWLVRMQCLEKIEQAHPSKNWDYQNAVSELYNTPVFVRVVDFPTSNWQIDTSFPRFLPLPEIVSRRMDLGDSIMSAMVLAPFSDRPVLFTDLERLRVQECERVVALRTELTKCGAQVNEQSDTLHIQPSPLHGAEIETYDDHRMAMCFAILGLKVPGIKIKNPACVKKTFPDFFQKLAAPPPHGLGATILDAKTGRKLERRELFADSKGH